jgi:hypothetical protein
MVDGVPWAAPLSTPIATIMKVVTQMRREFGVSLRAFFLHPETLDAILRTAEARTAWDAVASARSIPEYLAPRDRLTAILWEVAGDARISVTLAPYPVGMVEAFAAGEDGRRAPLFARIIGGGPL